VTYLAKSEVTEFDIVKQSWILLRNRLLQVVHHLIIVDGNREQPVGTIENPTEEPHCGSEWMMNLKARLGPSGRVGIAKLNVRVTQSPTASKMKRSRLSGQESVTGEDVRHTTNLNLTLTELTRRP
jgi:hypothetical protein